jgi:amino acid transporter/mannitol/fructose-specific phosphotransferase system IIA component (Ntr-type)
MVELSKSKRLKKELRLLDVYAIATGTTLSAGFFLLPGLAAAEAGPAVVLAYLLAALPLIPAMFSIIELATAMPRAGGVYYFVDRSLGPLVGMIGGIGTWFALVLKVSFALIGMGAYISLFIPELSITPLAIALAIVLGLLNALGARKSGGLQVLLVAGLLAILLGFIGGGLREIDLGRLRGLFSGSLSTLLGTAGLVYISYVGVTNVASLSEEVAKPERNLPRGVILALATAIVVYVLGTAVMVGLVPMEELAGDLTPVATAAGRIFGGFGAAILSIAALLAFISVANAGTMSASRYPLAMSRDHMMPRILGRLGGRGTPLYSILVTVAAIVIFLLSFDPTGIAKLASAFQLLMFALVCVAVIVMRESHIESYDPGYHSPLYPWMQIAGIVASLVFIVEMGWLPLLFTLGLILISVAWFRYYARNRVTRSGAMYHVFERLGRARHHGLERELRGILKEKGLRDEDPFEEIVARAVVIDLEWETDFEDVALQVAQWLSRRVPHTVEEIKAQFLEGTRTGATPVTHQVALPHLRIDNLEHPEMVLVRSRPGVQIRFNNPLTDHEDDEATVHALFFLISPEADPGRHLRILAQMAERVDDESFPHDWDMARGEQGLKDALLRHERYLELVVRAGDGTAVMIGKAVREIPIPEGCLITWLSRSDEVIVPRGSTVLERGDRLTVIGGPAELREFARCYLGGRA